MPASRGFIRADLAASGSSTVPDVADETIDSADAAPEVPQDLEQHAAPDRRVLVTLMIVAASVIGVLSAVNTWVERQLLDTEAWVETSSDLLADPEVRGALAAYLVDQVYETVDIDEELAGRMPDELDALAGLVAGALRQPATDGVERLLGTEVVASVWESVNRTAHETAVALLREEDVAGLSTEEGVIALRLGDLVKEVASELGVSEERLEQIPDDAGTIVILESDELATAQTAVQFIELMSVVFFVLVVGLYAAAVYLAGPRRREALRSVGVALAISGLVLWMVRRVAGRAVADSVGASTDGKAVALIVIDIATRYLGQIAAAAIVYGLVLVGFAALTGSTRVAIWLRTMLAPTLVDRPVAAGFATVAVFLVVAAVAPGELLERPWRAVLFLLLFVLGLVWLRRRLRDEFPDRSEIGVWATLKSGPGRRSDDPMTAVPASAD